MCWMFEKYCILKMRRFIAERQIVTCCICKKGKNESYIRVTPEKHYYKPNYVKYCTENNIWLIKAKGHTFIPPKWILDFLGVTW